MVWIVTGLALLLVTSILPGFHIDTGQPDWWHSLVRLPLIFTVLLILLRPLLLLLTLPLNVLTVGFPTLLFNGLILYLSAMFEHPIHITNYGEALLGTLVVTAISASITGWLGLDEAYPFYQSVIYRIARRFGPPRPQRKPLRGLLLLQADGVSLPSLRKALNRGRMPTVSAMLAKGTHNLFGWHCGIPSNTPAVQAGVFYGERDNVPGYRWFDRAAQKVRVVSNPDDLRLLEKQVAAEGSEPLLAGGSCINTFMSGGASKRLMTVTALGENPSQRRDGERADFNLFFLSPNAYTKAVLASMWDYLAGLVMSVAGLFVKSRPRLMFSIKRLAQRTLANAFLRDLSFYWMKMDMVRGVPVIYSNFVGYDDIAHYADPDSLDAQLSLAAFDRRLRTLRRRARRQSPIRYEIVLFSDHGQTPSIPFRLLYGKTFAQLMTEMFDRAHGRETEASFGRPGTFSPDRSYTLALLRELEEVGPDALGWVANRGRRALARVTEKTDPADAPRVDETKPGVVVCVSGSLAHIYFTGHAEPLMLEDIMATYPGLVDELVNHPGIGFVAASRRFGDAVALCVDGVRNLITGEMGERNDPLDHLDDKKRWAAELAQLMSYRDCGDLVVNGAWLADRQRIVVMEEQVSSHGGLGGRQTEPFIMLPADWAVTDLDLDSPEALHRLLKRELAQYRGSGRDGKPLYGGA
ncbi:MAG: phage holin family protein [Candidatus Krumholzibacteriota bacterium]